MNVKSLFALFLILTTSSLCWSQSAAFEKLEEQLKISFEIKSDSDDLTPNEYQAFLKDFAREAKAVKLNREYKEFLKIKVRPERVASSFSELSFGKLKVHSFYPDMNFLGLNEIHVGHCSVKGLVKMIKILDTSIVSIRRLEKQIKATTGMEVEVGLGYGTIATPDDYLSFLIKLSGLVYKDEMTKEKKTEPAISLVVNRENWHSGTNLFGADINLYYYSGVSNIFVGHRSAEELIEYLYRGDYFRRD